MNIWSYITIRCSVVSANHNNPLPASLKCNNKKQRFHTWYRLGLVEASPRIPFQEERWFHNVSCYPVLAFWRWQIVSEKNTTMLSGYILLECFLCSLVGGKKDQDWTCVLRAPCNVQISCKLTLTRNSSFHQILLQPISGLIGSCDQSCRKFFSLWN